MTKCEFSWRCSGLTAHLEGKPVLESIYRTRYCEQGSSQCARYIMACIGPLAIPDDLLPNQHHRLPTYGVPLDDPRQPSMAG